MVAGGVEWVHADVISSGALDLFKLNGIEVEYATVVPNIINRTGTDICPVEKLCRDCHTAAECLPLIDKFVAEMSR
jgi:iron complex outermembrane receptor protein